MGDTRDTPSGETAGGQPNANATGTPIAKSGDETGVTEEALRKSLDRLEQIVVTAPEGRKQMLFQKGGAGGLTAEENVELMKLMAGEGMDKSLSAAVQSALSTAGNEALNKSFDVSPFIDHLNENLTKSMAVIAEAVEKSDARHQQHIVVLAKGLMDFGKVLSGISQNQRAMAERIGVAMREPARAPKALGTPGGGQPNALEKGFGGGQPQGEQISKQEVFEVLERMSMKSLAEGRQGLSKSGSDITVESSQYEQFNQFSNPAFEQEVIAFAKSERQAKTNGHTR